MAAWPGGRASRPLVAVRPPVAQVTAQAPASPSVGKAPSLHHRVLARSRQAALGQGVKGCAHGVPTAPQKLPPPPSPPLWRGRPLVQVRPGQEGSAPSRPPQPACWPLAGLGCSSRGRHTRRRASVCARTGPVPGDECAEQERLVRSGWGCAGPPPLPHRCRQPSPVQRGREPRAGLLARGQRGALLGRGQPDGLGEVWRDEVTGTEGAPCLP